MRWRARVYDPATGRHLVVGTFDKRADARAAEGEARRKLGLTPDSMTFTELLDAYYSSRNVRDTTLRDYKTTLGRVHLGDKVADSITPSDVDTELRRIAKKYAATTAHKTLGLLRQVFTFGVERGYVTESPAAHKVSLPRVMRGKPRALTPEEVAAIMGEIPGHYRAAVATAVYTGLRRGELFGLRWPDYEGDHLNIKRQYGERGQVVPLKTPAAVRVIPVPDQLREILDAWREQVPYMEDGTMFPSERCDHVRASTFNQWVWRPACIRAGVPTARLHDLRHTYASALIRTGCSVKVVQTLLGHTDVTTTLGTYGHLFPSDAENAASSAASFLAFPSRAHSGE